MLKIVFVLCVAVALVMPMHEIQAFKVVNIYKGVPQSTAAATPAINASVLIQTVQSAITAKLQQVQTLVGSIVQQKTALTQNALNSIQSTMSAVKGQVQSTVGSARPAYVFRKNIYIGAAPEATTASSVDTTTIKN